MAATLPRIAGCLSAVGLILAPMPGAAAATQAASTDEIGGTSVLAHSTAQNLRSGWLSQVAANGGTASAPMTLTQPTYVNGSAVSGVINTAADGTTTSVARTRYTAGTSPTLVGPSTNPGTATCTTSGTSLQGGAPRPTSLESNSTCSSAAGFAWANAGGTGESTTRDAVEFTFSRPVLGFGAWFGDLETRTDGNGIPAVVRLYGPGGTLLSDQQVQPGPTYLPQSSCGGSYTGCGNNTTRWVGFVADPAQPVSRMVVIVGDDDPNGTALDEGIGFIGPTLDLSTASISLTKSADPLADTNADGVVGAGDTVHYTFAVTNTGSLPASSVSVTDPNAAALSCPAGPVASATVTCTGRHQLSQAEVNAGSLTNTATATASAYGGTVTSSPSTLVLPISPTPGLRLTKTVAEPTFAAPGDVLHFRVVARNNGNVTLSGLSVADARPGPGAFSSTCDTVPGTLAPGDVADCDVTYTVTQADVDNGTVTNSAQASASAPGGASVGPVTATATSTAVQQVGLTLSKSVDEPTYDAAGDTLTYTLRATNSGNVTLTAVDVTDAAPGDGAFTLDCAALPTTLPPGGSGTCTATYDVTQDDLDAQSVTNVAGATARGSGTPVQAPDASATSTVVARPGLAIVKTVDEPVFDQVGDELGYDVVVTNTGNLRVHDLTLSDDAPGPGAFDLDCSGLPARLAPGASGSCVATYTVTQADLDRGTVANDAQATGLLPTDEPIASPTATAASAAAQSSSLSLVKSTDDARYDTAGDVLSYTVSVTNAGNVTLSGVEVADPAPGAGAFSLDCSALPTTLAPGESGTCTASYTTTQADLDDGSVTNVASARADAPGGAVNAPDATATSTARQSPALSVVKSVDAAEYDTVGDVLSYTVDVTNTGNVGLTGVGLTDAAPGTGAFALDCSGLPTTLAPGDGGVCTATYRVTQADLDDGSVTNTATAAASAPNAVLAAQSLDITSTAQQSTALEVTKTVDADTYDAVGDVLTYEVTATNTGNVTLRGVAVVDSAPGDGAFDLDCADLPATLAPGEGGTCTATYTVVQSDLDAGLVVNAASAAGDGPTGEPVQSQNATATSTAVPTGVTSLTLVKTVDAATFDAVGDTLTYTLTATNIGNQTLSGVTVSDLSPGDGAFTLDCSALPVVLAPAASGTCTATYDVAQADLDAGSVTNTANAGGTGPGGVVSTATDDATSTAQQAPSLSAAKSVDADRYDAAGDVLSYTIDVSNTGNVVLSGVAVDDPAPGSGDYTLDCGALPSVLAPGEGGSCAATYRVTQADVDAGSVTNVASVSANGPTSEVTAPDAAATATAQQAPVLSLTKTVDAATYDSPGDVLTYTVTAENTGNVALTDVQVDDPAPGDGAYTLDCSGLPSSLPPGGVGSCTATYAVTQDDLDAGTVVNTATAEAAGPGGVVFVSPPASATSSVDGAAALSLVKQVDSAGFDAVGDVLRYTITVRNSGNLTLDRVRVTDNPPGDGAFSTTCGDAVTLAPGEEAVCTASYTVTEADLSASSLTNTASASAAGTRSVAASAVSSSDPGPDGGGPDGGDGEGPGLPGTGADGPRWLAPLGGVLVLAGVVVVAASRRRPSPR